MISCVAVYTVCRSVFVCRVLVSLRYSSHVMQCILCVDLCLCVMSFIKNV